jgi:hypothetical protein
MNNSILVRFNGGLGNQISQYAMIRLLNQIYPGRKIYGDVSVYDNAEIHNGFELNRIFENVCLIKNSKILRHIEKYYLKRNVIEQQYADRYPEDERIFHLMTDQAYELIGTWHNYNYNCIRKQLLEELRFPAVNRQNESVLRQINSTNSVSIHVRRGDYVNLGLDIVGSDYYKAAIKLIASKIENPVYFVFSDENVEELFPNEVKNIVYVRGNIGKMAYVDMQLMSCCKHNIIANSTFSYWGSWLNTNQDRIVIRPQMQTKERKTWKVDGWIEL